TNTDEGTDDGKGGREPAIARYKGLGEMNADQLWDTTLNPATRTLKRVTLDDAELADLAFDELMGTEVEGRKKWIMANAGKEDLRVVGEIARDRGRVIETHGTVARADDGTVLAEADATFLRMPDGRRRELEERYAGTEGAFARVKAAVENEERAGQHGRT